MNTQLKPKVLIAPSTSCFSQEDIWAQILFKTLSLENMVFSMIEDKAYCCLAFQYERCQKVYICRAKTWKEIFDLEWSEKVCKMMASELKNRQVFSQAELKTLMNTYFKGKRVKCLSMEDPYHPVPDGTEGTIQYMDDWMNIHVAWDTHSSLALLPEVDRFCFV